MRIEDFYPLNQWKVQKGLGHYYLVDESTKQRYRYLSKHAMRGRAVGLFFATPLLQLVASVAAIGLRIIRLLSFWHFWKEGGSPSFKAALLDTGKELLKITIQPLVFLSLQLLPVYGMIRPYDAIKLYNNLELFQYDRSVGGKLFHVSPVKIKNSVNPTTHINPPSPPKPPEVPKENPDPPPSPRDTGGTPPSPPEETPSGPAGSGGNPSPPPPPVEEDLPPPPPPPVIIPNVTEPFSDIFNGKDIDDFAKKPFMMQQQLITKALTLHIQNHIFSFLPSVNIKETITNSLTEILRLSNEKRIRIPIKENDLFNGLIIRGVEEALSDDKRIDQLTLLSNKLIKDYPTEFPKPFQELIEAKLKECSKHLKAPDFDRSGNVNELEKILPRLCKIIKNAPGEVAPAFKKPLSEIGQRIKEYFLEQFTLIHDRFSKNKDITADEARYTEALNRLVLVFEDGREEDMVHEVQKELNGTRLAVPLFTQIGLSEQMGSPKVRVAQSITAVGRFLDAEVPILDDFLSCLKEVLQLLKNQDLNEMAKSDLILERYLFSLRATILQAAEKIEPVYKASKFDFSIPETSRFVTELTATVDGINALLDVGLAFKFEMDQSHADLKARLFSILGDNRDKEIDDWIASHPHYDLDGFETWLPTMEPGGGDCETIYANFVAATLVD